MYADDLNRYEESLAKLRADDTINAWMNAALMETRLDEYQAIAGERGGETLERMREHNERWKWFK